MDPFDLDGLDSTTAKEIVVRVIQSLKTTTAQREKSEKEYELWSGRVKLAIDNGRDDLEAEAKTRLSDVEFQLESIRAEEAELKRTADRLKRQLKELESRPAMNIDADRLLAELELMGGERDELADEFRKHEADELLRKLKQDIEDEG